MKIPQILAIIGLFSSSILAVPSQFAIKDANSATAADNEISPGRYIISNPNGLAIGRSRREDLSLNPKRIITESKDSDIDTILWDVKKLPNGNYILSIRGNPTAAIENNLYAVLLDYPAPTEWKIIYQEGPKAYTIERADYRGGWVVGYDEGDQVSVRPLIIGPSVPPFFPPTEVFTFKPADYDDLASNDFHEKQEVHVDVTISIE